jgi:hypothetical protein
MSPAFEPLERVRKTDCPEFFSETAGLLSQGKSIIRNSILILYVWKFVQIGKPVP